MLRKAISFILITFLTASFKLSALNLGKSTLLAYTNDSIAPVTEKVIVPAIDYGNAKKYEIADIKVSGLTSSNYEDYTIIGFSQLSVGDKIEIPGPEISNAVSRYWKQGLFSEVEILADKVDGDKIWLDIKLKERPRISDIVFTGVKKGEKKDLEARIGMVKSLQSSRHQLNRAEEFIKKYYADKGFNKAVVKLSEQPDLSKDNHVILHIDVQKKNKTKINDIQIEGNEEVQARTLTGAMKKTRYKKGLRMWIRNFLRSTNFNPDNFEEDKENLIAKYNQLGYRDAEILWDTVYAAPDKPQKVNIDIKVNEGNKYFLRDIRWVGNTKVTTEDLNHVLMMKKGDVYDQKKLLERLTMDDDAVMVLFYQNRGYLFSNADPVEINVANDSVDLEIRIVEGPQATVRKVTIMGNDRIYEDVIRRELRVKPGALYSRNDLLMTMREIGQTGHFHLEGFQPTFEPDQEAGVVDIGFPLQSKASDQIEFSAGWGQTGVIGRLSLKFNNFSIRNLFKPKSYKGIIPQGDGQTLSISAQTNARYYQAYSLSFFDPWFGGKRPNSLSVGLYYSKQTDVATRFANNYINNMYNYGGYYGGGMSNNGGYGYDLGVAADASKSIQMMGVSVGYGKRLTWPDDNFYFQAELNYQLYRMRDWQYFIVRNGDSHSLALTLSLNRRSIDDPVYTKRGSEFSFSVSLTPPFSLWDGKDYASFKPDAQGYEPGAKFKWIEYNKWKFKAKTYTSLYSAKRQPVIMTRAEFGFVGYYNKNKRSPFETFTMGGDGMTGYTSTYATETIGLRGYENGSIGSNASAFARFGVELRYPLILEPTSTIYVLGFVEAGNAWGEISSFNPFELKRSAGFGARIMLPMIGLMGIDWGYGFDPVRGSRDYGGSRFHFIIGQEF